VCVIPWGANGQGDGLDDVGFYRITSNSHRIVIEHSLQPSVGLCVCLSVQRIVAKRLMGYGCGFGW